MHVEYRCTILLMSYMLITMTRVARPHPLTPCQAVDNLQGVFDRDWNSVYTRPLPPFTPN